MVLIPVIQSDITLNISTDNLSAQEQEVMQTIVPLVNDFKLSVVTYINRNGDNTAYQMKNDIKITGLRHLIWDLG